MLTRITQFFAAPTFEDEARQRAANLLSVMVNVILAISVLMVVVLTLVSAQSFWGNTTNVMIMGSLVFWMLGMRILIWRGWTQIAGVLMSLVLWVALTYSVYGFYGIRNSTTSGFFLCILVAGLLLGGRATLIFAALSIAAVFGLWYIETLGLVTYQFPKSPPPFDLWGYSAIFVVGGLLLYYAVRNLNRSLELAQRNERAQVEANRELQKLRASLEHQVADRTRDLQRRTVYLEASAQVSHAASSILDVDQLTRQVVELIRERFGLSYVGLFLVDRSGEWAELVAGTGEAGRAMVAQGHRMPIEGDSTIGWSITRGLPRVVQEAEKAERQAATDLPGARSEAALPLHSRGQAIGALTVQSDHPDVFDGVAIEVLQSMADQIAVALDNARLFAESKAALEAERRAYGQYSRETWSQMMRTGLTPGYAYARKHLLPIGDERSPEIDAALREDKTVVMTDPDGATLALPVQVRGQTIGVVDLRKSAESGGWSQEEIALMETLAEQLGVALESARLYQDTQRRAMRERLINEITARIRSAITTEGVLNVAVREISQATGARYAAIDLLSQAEQPHASTA